MHIPSEAEADRMLGTIAGKVRARTPKAKSDLMKWHGKLQNDVMKAHLHAVPQTIVRVLRALETAINCDLAGVSIEVKRDEPVEALGLMRRAGRKAPSLAERFRQLLQ